jgi:hypothetical protein
MEPSLTFHVLLSLGLLSTFSALVLFRKTLNSTDKGRMPFPTPLLVVIATSIIGGFFAAARVQGLAGTDTGAYAFLIGCAVGAWLGHVVEPRAEK